MPSERVYLAFHETMALNTPSISAILGLSYERRGQINSNIVREQTSLGANYVKAMPRYARGCGLLAMDSYRLTHLGELVCRQDPHLTKTATLWLMHYHLSAPQGPGPAFWSHLVTRFLPFAEEVSGAEITSEIARFHESQPGAQVLQDRTVRGTATVFVGTYTKSDGLGQLGLMKKTGGRDGLVLVGDSQWPPLGAVAYALADYWTAHYGEQVTVNLSELARDDGFGRLMWMDHHHLAEALEELRREGIVDVYRIAPPYQVVRQWSNKEELLARLYD